MTKTTTGLDPEIYRYLLESSLREPPVLAKLRAETAKMPRAQMQVAPDQGQFLALLTRLTGAKRIVEVGTFTGYSSTAMALALPKGGKLTCCDVSKEFTDVARRYWAEAGIAERIELRLGPALETLDALIAGGEAGRFDMVFIDADKSNYAGYYERALILLRPGGLVAVDNVLWSGRPLDPGQTDEDTQAIRAFNAALKDDTRIHLSMLSIADGVTLAVKL